MSLYEAEGPSSQDQAGTERLTAKTSWRQGPSSHSASVAGQTRVSHFPEKPQLSLYDPGYPLGPGHALAGSSSLDQPDDLVVQPDRDRAAVPSLAHANIIAYTLWKSPSLVLTGVKSIKPREPERGERDIEVCPRAGWLLGECCHGTKRWIKLSCKRRDCPVCGWTRKHLISWRIAQGVEELGGDSGAAWFVGTWDCDIPKAKAVKVVRQFIQKLRREQPQIQYASTWEVQRNGRLHVNLVMVPFRYIPQARISEMWQRFGGGRVVWIERVGKGIGHEAAKDRDRIGAYVAKWDQMVKNGRGVTYSKGWPKLPDRPSMERRGKIAWHWVGEFDPEDIMFEYERSLGHWVEARAGEYASPYGEECDCFEVKVPEDRGPPAGELPGPRGFSSHGSVLPNLCLDDGEVSCRE